MRPAGKSIAALNWAPYMSKWGASGDIPTVYTRTEVPPFSWQSSFADSYVSFSVNGNVIQSQGFGFQITNEAGFSDAALILVNIGGDTTDEESGCETRDW